MDRNLTLVENKYSFTLYIQMVHSTFVNKHFHLTASSLKMVEQSFPNMSIITFLGVAVSPVTFDPPSIVMLRLVLLQDCFRD
jgi:hypothetical protein